MFFYFWTCIHLFRPIFLFLGLNLSRASNCQDLENQGLGNITVMLSGASDPTLCPPPGKTKITLIEWLCYMMASNSKQEIFMPLFNKGGILFGICRLVCRSVDQTMSAQYLLTPLL